MKLRPPRTPFTRQLESSFLECNTQGHFFSVTTQPFISKTNQTVITQEVRLKTNLSFATSRPRKKHANLVLPNPRVALRYSSRGRGPFVRAIGNEELGNYGQQCLFRFKAVFFVWNDGKLDLEKSLPRFDQTFLRGVMF